MDNTENVTFAGLGCAEPFLAALDARGFDAPTPVQAECFAPGMEGRDLMVQSRTGSGKTLAFGLPLMHRLEDGRRPQAIILTPTRELAQQVAAELRSVNRGLDMAQLVGGMSYTPQLRALSEGARVIVGTPGRVMDHMERGTLDLSHVRMVVLDECDEMLNMGFIEDVEHILADVPPGPQTYLFSATLPAPIASLARRFLKNPHHVEMTGGGGVAQHADISHTACLIPDHLHVKALANILLHDEPGAALIFTKMKQQTEEVAEALRNAGLAADYLHGDLNQGARNRIMGGFKAGRLRYLVATDVAARGIDVEGLPLVVNMGIPTQFENYIHRTGRTGRAGLKGTSLSLVGHRESRILLAWARRGGLNLEWRDVPSPDEIRRERSRRLGERVRGQEATAFAGLAETLLGEMDPKGLVAVLLSMIEDDAHLGFDMPETAEPRKRGAFGDYKEGPRKRGGRRDWPADRHGDGPSGPSGTREPRDRYRPDKPDKYAKPDKYGDGHKDRDERKAKDGPGHFGHADGRPKAYKGAAKSDWQDERPARARKAAVDESTGDRPPRKAAPYKYDGHDGPPPRSRKAAPGEPDDRPPRKAAPYKYDGHHDGPPARSRKAADESTGDRPPRKAAPYKYDGHHDGPPARSRKTADEPGDRPPRKAAPYKYDDHHDGPPPRGRKTAAGEPGDRPPRRSAPYKYETQDAPPARGAAKRKDADAPAAKKKAGFNPPWPIPGMKKR